MYIFSNHHYIFKLNNIKISIHKRENRKHAHTNVLFFSVTQLKAKVMCFKSQVNVFSNYYVEVWNFYQLK